ncbi:hypothetical protein [uncultured Draconibacterium sp.]|uniref:hypothetical protein n=1 Tax=uncultured Draconibacterium sp. TaxID=1573823 RepID=UPI0029C98AEE|nr:hypothetical protein [uncultured Draconibacterium sp.]
MGVKTIFRNKLLQNILLNLSMVLLIQQSVWAQSAEKKELSGTVQTADVPRKTNQAVQCSLKHLPLVLLQ